ncbi:hypothetical protein NOF04DRAFT_5895 [Fusarium oxysporum II5]|uniref:Uncharacterized protein n=2 Tax=Fusarium oxysporum species complex TaxID=171631 RepID=X0IM63_FUSO5|nr:uncharacterized protein FOIG_16735 [Fusarium odoratissimum NRRL 54006]EXL89983.1 hypothetical protein FOIG_16735 [Fusarium odoratissimum NRRL 54006]KAK2122205.1 hypothetical protein NOF04DRAFT_5895 [Fusarium oxysporum II5]TXB98048.1 hypothetical protein FocTR4_00017145 [Fusarium oxysporum f. sp. cubense]
MPFERRTAHLVFTAIILPSRHLEPKLSELLFASVHCLITISHRPNPAGVIEDHDGVYEGGLRQELLVERCG